MDENIQSDEAATQATHRWRHDETDPDLTWGVIVDGTSFFDTARTLVEIPAGELDVLEIGPGYGRLLEWLLDADRIRTFVGLDLSKNRVARLSEKFQDRRCRFVVEDANDFELDREFDLFVCSATFEHLFPSIDAALARVTAHIRPSGLLLFDLLQGDDELKLRWANLKSPDMGFIRVYSRDEVEDSVERAGLELVALRSYVLPLGNFPLILDRGKAPSLIRNEGASVYIGDTMIGIERTMVCCRKAQ